MQYKIDIGGRTIVLSDLGEPIESLFKHFYEEFMANRPLPWDDLAVSATAYFDSNAASTAAHDAYFNNFVSLWRIKMEHGAFAEAEFIWDRALQPALSWEQTHPGRRLHKGTPYYFWAMTVITRRDMDRGYLLAHRAIDEDVQTDEPSAKTKPGYALVSLNDEKPDQAFRAWVVAQAQYLEQLLNAHNSTYARTLTLADVKQKFLTNPPTIDTLFLFTYTLARLMNLADMPGHTRTNAFAGQLELNILFDITLVIDAATKAKDHQEKFINHAAHLLATAGHPLTALPELKAINKLFRNDFDGTLRAALDGTLALPGKALNRLQCDVALAYGIRNYGAHNTGTAPTIYNRFQEVEQALFRTVFTTIEYLY